MEENVHDCYVVAAAAREQYMHQAHWIIERGDEHLDQSKESAERVEQGIRRLVLNADPGQRSDLESIERSSKALSQRFMDSVRPAVLANDLESIKRYHMELNRQSERLSHESDVMTQRIQQAMAEMHRKAVVTSEWGMAVTVLCITSVLVTSAFFVVRLRRAVVKPAEELADAARVVAQGNFEVRVPGPGEGELGALAGAFNRMTEELAMRERRLIQSERMAAIGQLAAGIGHEINNPIGIIRGYLKTLQLGSLPEPLKSELRILDEEAAACERLATDLLDYSRTSRLFVSAVEMDRLSSETIARFLETADARGRIVEADLRPGTVQGDSGRIRQVVLNLLKNAVQASSKDSVVKVVGCPGKDGGYTFTVEDQGSGIAKEDLGRIFEPFFSKNPKGTGLGLAVCQGIVRAHGGSISIAPGEGRGTVVTVSIPGRPPGEAG